MCGAPPVGGIEPPLGNADLGKSHRLGASEVVGGGTFGVSGPRCPLRRSCLPFVFLLRTVHVGLDASRERSSSKRSYAK